MRKQLLFVTYESEDLDEGLNYAIDLAKTMDRDISILIANNKKTFRDRFDDLMTAVTFAEAGEHETARQVLDEGGTKSEETTDEKVGHLAERCRMSGINVNIHSAAMDILSAIRNFLTQKAGIDMVLLGPSVTDSGNVSARELNKLVRTASRPIVTMARQALVHAH